MKVIKRPVENHVKITVDCDCGCVFEWNSETDCAWQDKFLVNSITSKDVSLSAYYVICPHCTDKCHFTVEEAKTIPASVKNRGGSLATYWLGK